MVQGRTVSPRQLNIFIAHIVANVSVGPFISITVDVPYPNPLTYMLSTFSPPVAAASTTQDGHIALLENHCLR